VGAPSSGYENQEAKIDTQARAHRRAVELARESLKGAGACGGEVQKALRRMIRANRAGADAVVDLARSATSRAARRVDRLPLPRRARPRPARPSRIAVVEGDSAETRAG
jgi:hypothetical protein